MHFPETFPEGTQFYDVDCVPVTRHPGQRGALAWDDPEAPQARWFPAEMAARGTRISQAECQALFLRNVHRASPSRLVAAAIELQQLRDSYPRRLRDQGLTEAQIREAYARNRAEHQVLAAEQLAIRLIGRAMTGERTA